MAFKTWATGDQVLAADLNNDFILANQQQNLTYLTAGGSANAQTATPLPAWTSYVAGHVLCLKIATANTGATTLNVSALGAKNIFRQDLTALKMGDLVVGQIAYFVYDGTQFILSNLPPIQSLFGTLASTNLETAGRFTQTLAGTGAATFGTNGCLWQCGANANSHAQSTWALTGAANSVLASGNPVFSAMSYNVGPTVNASNSGFYIGVGTVTFAAGAITWTPNHFGFKWVWNGSNIKFYATQADGATEAASAGVNVNATDVIDMVAIHRGTQVDYYWSIGGGAIQTVSLTTNYPALGASIGVIQAGVGNAATASNASGSIGNIAYRRWPI